MNIRFVLLSVFTIAIKIIKNVKSNGHLFFDMPPYKKKTYGNKKKKSKCHLLPL